jgi:hypothetical protein
MARVLRYLWAGPTTAIGLGLGLLALAGGRVRAVDGVLEVEGPLLGSLLRRAPGSGILAITLGHVVLGVDAAALEATRAHERVHVRQYERWGPLFVPAYLAAGAWALVRGRHPYHDNRFEREAREDSKVLRCQG